MKTSAYKWKLSRCQEQGQLVALSLLLAYIPTCRWGVLTFPLREIAVPDLTNTHNKNLITIWA